MKKLFYALMLVLGMSVLVSCQKEGSDSDSIVGTWIRVTEEWEEGSITTFRRASNREIKQYLKYL